MAPLLILLLVQCVFAIGVVFVLKNFLNKELMGAALENFEACKISPEVREIVVRAGCAVDEEFKAALESVRRRKFAQARLNIQDDPGLKGGIVIAAGDVLLDFSLASRWQQLWS